MNYINNKNYYPMLVSDNALKDDSPEVFLTKWEQYDTISKKLQDLLCSKELAILIGFIADKHNLTDLEAANVSRNIRKLFFRESSEEVFSEDISKILGGDNLNGKTIISAIKKLKISDTPLSVKKPELESITLKKALIKYPEIKNELITSNYLKFPNSDKKKTPTIINWLDLYDQEVGVKKQTTVQRGKFLYSSINCSKLSEKERGFVSKLLQSRDEEIKLNLDKETHKIIITHESTDVNNYKLLISKTKIFDTSSINSLSTKSSYKTLIEPLKKITSIKSLKGKRSSLTNISPQHFAMLPNNAKLSSDNINKQEKNQWKDLNKKSNKSKISDSGKLSFSSGQKLSTETNKVKSGVIK